MRIFGYLGVSFLIVCFFAPAQIAMADTAPVVAPDTTQSSPQPTPDEQDLPFWINGPNPLRLPASPLAHSGAANVACVQMQERTQ